METRGVLAAMAAAMSRASSLEAIYAEALDALGRISGAARASILLFDRAGVLRVEAWRGLSEAYRAAATGLAPFTCGQPAPTPVLVADVATDPSLAEHRDVTLGEGIRALAVFPLTSGRGTIGQATAYFDDAPHVVAPDVALALQALAAHTAFAIDRLDATERGREADDVRDAEARLRESQRLEGLGVLAGGIAHDFNNLLVGVLSNASLALSQLPPGPAHDTVYDIQHAARMAADLSRQLLAYAGKGRFVVARLDLSRLVEDAAQLISTAISRKARVSRALASDLPPVEGDATQLRQIAMNLLSNASDALMDEPGHVTLSTGTEVMDGARRDNVFPDGQVNPGRYVYLEVRDTGHGMDPAQIPRIFDPFYTTKFQGRGLGLAAVLGIVRGHEGAIRVDSVRGVGSTFRLLLPAREPTAVAAVPRPTPSVPRLGDGAVVLVVDDEPIVRKVSQRILERTGYKVLLAANGHEALRLVAERGDEIAVVLLDLTMPELSGEETFEMLRERSPKLPVVITSGYSKETSAHLAARGLAGFLEKPYSAVELVEIIQRVVRPKQL